MTAEVLSIRPQMIKDARDFFRILTTGNFAYFPVNVASVAAEERFLRSSIRQWKNNEAWNFSILLGNRIIGAVGIMPEDSRPYNAEIGYFIDREFHGHGYALKALQLAEQYAVANLPSIRRFQAFIVVDNHPSVAVVKKAGFAQEGILKGYLRCCDSFFDAYVFGRIIR